MTGVVLLDVAIGVIFVLLVFSLIASALQEAVAGVLNWRGKTLRRGVQGLMSDNDLGLAVLDHGLIRGLHGPLKSREGGTSSTNRRLPSNIPPPVFARAFVETLLDQYEQLKAKEGSPDKALAIIRDRINNIAIDDRLKKRLKGLIEATEQGTEALDDVSAALGRVKDRVAVLGLDTETGGKVVAVIGRVESGADWLKDSISAAMQAVKEGLAEASLEDALKARLSEMVDHVEAGLDAARAELVATVAAIELQAATCFEQAMDRVVGWYVRRTKLFLFLIGTVMAAAVNFNLLGYAKDLIDSDELRTQIVAQAQLAADTGKLGEPPIGVLAANRSTVWAKADAGEARDGTITAAELTAFLADPGLGPLGRLALGKEAGAAITLEEAQAAYDAAWARLARFDADGDRKIAGAEADSAAGEAIAELQDEVVRSLTMLRRELGEQGVPLGWPCNPGGDLCDCVLGSLGFAAVLSWLVIGLGCTLGGQFWYDMLKNFLKVRTAAAGVASEATKPAVPVPTRLEEPPSGSTPGGTLAT